MSRRVLFTLAGDPVPKGRPRHTKTGRTYTPKRTRAYEDEIGNAWVGEGPRPPQFLGPVRVLIQVRERVYPSDLDNYVKVVLDALNGLAWPDDRQVEVIHATIERRHPLPGITVEVVDCPARAESRTADTEALFVGLSASQSDESAPVAHHVTGAEA